MLGQIFAVVSACGLFVGGHQFLKHYLCKGTHHEIDSLVTTLFSASFSLSSGLLLLVLYEILGIVDENFRGRTGGSTCGASSRCWCWSSRSCTYTSSRGPRWE